MKRRKPTKKQMEEAKAYNNELWFSYITSTEKNIDGDEDKIQSLDLIRAINSFRTYKTPKAVVREYPELYGQLEYIKMLWQYFGEKTEEELSDLFIEMIHETTQTMEKKQ